MKRYTDSELEHIINDDHHSGLDDLSDTLQFDKKSGWVIIAGLIGLVIFLALQNSYYYQQKVIEKYQQASSNPKRITTPLSSTEMEHLLYMREEEKMALDIYQLLSAQWKLKIFSSISQSEARHSHAMALLLEQYNIPDPALNRAKGVFQNREIDQLYKALAIQGKQSKLEALRVGALIEEVDIRDLDRAIADSSTHPDLVTAYKKLRTGSYHHLRAFTHALEIISGPYVARILPQSRVDQIIDRPLVTITTVETE